MLAAIGGMRAMLGMVDVWTVMRQDMDVGLQIRGAWICADCVVGAVLTIVRTLFAS